MAELTPIPTAQRPADPGYQPISGYAVAAAITAGLFALFLVVLLITAVQSGRTPFSYELLVLPVIGIVLAAVGRAHIRNSEGTRTGMRMSTAAWWVCVLGGAGYFAFIYANEVVLERESARYAEKFFDELKAGRLTHGFQYLLPASDRDRADPDVPEQFELTYAPNGYVMYKNHDLVKLLVRNGSAVELTRLGVKDLGQESEGFQATHLYRLTCPEGEFNLQVKLVAPESRRSRRPEWFIPAAPSPNIGIQLVRANRYGRLVIDLEQEGAQVARTWTNRMSSGRLALGHLMTTPRAHREPMETALSYGPLAAGGSMEFVPFGPGLLPPDRARGLSPGIPDTPAGQARLSFEDLQRIGFFRLNSAGAALPADKLTRLRELWVAPRLVPATTPRQMGMAQIPAEVPRISFAPDRITVTLAAELSFDNPLHFAKCVIGVTCTNPDLLSALDAARKSGTPDDGTGVLSSLPPRDWQISWFRTDMEQHSVVTGPGNTASMSR